MGSHHDFLSWVKPEWQQIHLVVASHQSLLQSTLSLLFTMLSLQTDSLSLLFSLELNTSLSLLCSMTHFHFHSPLWYTFTFIQIASLSLSVPLHDGVPALLPDPRVGLRPHPRLPHFPLWQWSRQGTSPSGKTERWQCEREACVVTFNLLLAGPRQPTC